MALWSNVAVGLYMAVASMLLGNMSFGFGLAHIPASTATTISLIEPVVAAFLSILIVGEGLTATG